MVIPNVVHVMVESMMHGIGSSVTWRIYVQLHTHPLNDQMWDHLMYRMAGPRI